MLQEPRVTGAVGRTILQQHCGPLFSPHHHVIENRQIVLNPSWFVMFPFIFGHVSHVNHDISRKSFQQCVLANSISVLFPMVHFGGSFSLPRWETIRGWGDGVELHPSPPASNTSSSTNSHPSVHLLPVVFFVRFFRLMDQPWLWKYIHTADNIYIYISMRYNPDRQNGFFPPQKNPRYWVYRYLSHKLYRNHRIQVQDHWLQHLDWTKHLPS